MHQSDISGNSTWLELSSNGSLALCEVSHGQLNIHEVGIFVGATHAGFISPDVHIGIVQRKDQS
ncbi:MAG: hypothetical protein ACKPJJ_06205, partial [Planctomycetaceae bacterium]